MIALAMFTRRADIMGRFARPRDPTLCRGVAIAAGDPHQRDGRLMSSQQNRAF
jgi:hypothetical protein